MKVLLIFPRIEHGQTTIKDKKSWTSKIFGNPIITLPHIAALTPSKHQVKIVNENYTDLDFNEECDIIGITCYTMTAPRVYEIADEFRKRGKTVVLGGYHPTAKPQEASKHADSIILGMAEASWPKLLNDFENGKLKPIYEKDHDFKPEDIPPIRRDLIQKNPIIGAVQWTRGCGNKCEFCAISSFCERGVMRRPIKDVVKEIKEMPNKFVVFHDPHLTSHPRQAKELFKEMIRQKVNKTWLANGTTNVLLKCDDEFLNLARKAGCMEWFIGFESVSQKVLDSINKTHNTVENYKKLINKLHRHNMLVQGGIIFGFDEDEPDVFDYTLECIYDLGIDIVEVNILTPYPGTPLYDRLEKDGRILTYDWSKYNQTEVVFQPKNMTVKELFEGTRKVAQSFYSIPNVAARLINAFWYTKRISAFIPAGGNLSYRRYYKRDYHFDDYIGG
jgi:radical SAM superfamily enzyme YgiQ (UPF0313 family)